MKYHAIRISSNQLAKDLVVTQKNTKNGLVYVLTHLFGFGTYTIEKIDRDICVGAKEANKHAKKRKPRLLGIESKWLL